MRLIVARHGETAYNRDGLILGQSDSILTVNGLATVHRMAEMLSVYGPEAIFSSTLGRAAYTSAIYSERLCVPIYFREALAELSCGIWEGGKRSDLEADQGSLRNAWTERPTGGESFADAETRVISLISEIRTSGNCSNILIVGHAAVNRVLLGIWLGLEPGKAIKLVFPHDAVYIIEDTTPVRHRFVDGPERQGLLFGP